MPTAWRCEVCGYVHGGAEPPARCPVCGVECEMFAPIEVVVAPARRPAAASWRCPVCDHRVAGQAPPLRCPVCGAPGSALEPADDGASAATTGEARRIVVLGGGVAGVTAAERAHDVAPEASITLVSDEPGLPYVRLNLTRLLAGEVAEHEIALQPEDWYASRHIERVEGSAGAIRRGARALILEDGRTLPYDRLVLACGAHAFVPPIPGIEGPGVFTLRSLADARRLLGVAAPGTRLVCIGGGLLGLETAGALARRGCRVTVLEGSGWLLPRQLAEPAGRVLQRHVESAGIGVHCGVHVASIERGGGSMTVRIADVDALPADVVVVAAGVRPESWIARMAGLEVRQGVVVDDRMTTSDPAVLAAGDVAEHAGTLYGIWPVAWMQGAVAGAVAAGGDAAFAGMRPSTRLKVLDVDVFSAGRVDAPDASYAVHEEERDGAAFRFVCRDGRLVGATALGDARAAALLLEVVQAGTPISLSPPLLERFPALAAFGGVRV